MVHSRRNRRRRSHKLPRESKTIPLQRDGEDDGIWYRCWHCGQICKDGRDSLGGSESQAGTVYTETLSPSIGVPINARSVEISRMTVSPQADSDGNPRSADHVFETSGDGCPLCHSKNWKGVYP